MTNITANINERGFLTFSGSFDVYNDTNETTIIVSAAEQINGISTATLGCWIEIYRYYNGLQRRDFAEVTDSTYAIAENNPKGTILNIKFYFVDQNDNIVATTNAQNIQFGLTQEAGELPPGVTPETMIIGKAFCDFIIIEKEISFYNLSGAKVATGDLSYTVGADDIADGAVTSAKLAGSAVTKQKLGSDVTAKIIQTAEYTAENSIGGDLTENGIYEIVLNGTVRGYIIVQTDGTFITQYYFRGAYDVASYVANTVLGLPVLYRQNNGLAWTSWRDLKNDLPANSVTSIKIADGAVTYEKLNDEIDDYYCVQPDIVNVSAATASHTYSFAAKNNTDTRCETVTAIAFTMPDGQYPSDYISSLSFNSGATPPEISYTGTGALVWTGTDCTVSGTSYIFTPAASTHYDIIFYFNGTNLVGAVSGYVTPSGGAA